MSEVYEGIMTGLKEVIEYERNMRDAAIRLEDSKRMHDVRKVIDNASDDSPYYEIKTQE